jgi:hypothetical protein
MFVSDYREVGHGEVRDVIGGPPLLGAERSMVRAFQGRFCFDFGLATSCLKTTVSLKEGESYALKVSVGGQWGSISHDLTYAMERTISYEVGECDSVSPVLMYDDSELHVFEVTRSVLGFSWRYNETVFVPGGRPVLCGNRIFDDPACGCSSDRPPTGDPNDRVSVNDMPIPSRILRTSSFAAAPAAPAPDPEEAVTSGSQLLEESIGDLREVGIVGVDGEVAWLTPEAASPEVARPTLLSSDCNAALRGRIHITERDPNHPLFAVMPEVGGAGGIVTVYLDEHGGLVEFLRQPAIALSNEFTTIWAGVDFSDIRAGTAGLLELQMTDAFGDHVGQPMRQPFDVIHQPVTMQEPVYA